ncbi:MAG: VacB/RNase II family 3'-5' exoribonuclease [Candidatus Cloacimonetes bacterium]|nr:VacB/RNase II family 3'-5' exoribonuclease [Candidatus Cloacimonadota bacterium]
MKINIIETQNDIISFLSERAEKQYTTTQITGYLGLKKENRNDIQLVLNQLVLSGLVEKKSKRYSIVDKQITSLTKPKKNIIKNKDTFVGKPNNNNKTKIGKFDATSLAKNLSYSFVNFEDGNDVYVSAEDTLNAYHGDMVEVEITSFRDHKRYGYIKRVVTRNKEKFIGIIEIVRNKKYFRSDNLKIHTLFEVYDKNPTSIIDGLWDNFTCPKVSVKIVNWGLRQKHKLPLCTIEEILGESGNPEVEILSVIKEFDLPLEFPPQVVHEANLFNEDLSEIEITRRKDFRSLYTITIDPFSAKDFDDAISIEVNNNGDFHLYVHIADVAHYIKLGSALFNEAKARGNSYYFPKKVIPMLPERLSNKLCSLRPAENKYTITVMSVFDKEGSLKKQSIFESVIRSDVRLAYEEVDEYFEGKNTDISLQLSKTLDIMRMLSQYLSNEKTQRGYLRFDLPEIELVYDDDGYVQDIVRTQNTESHTLIENFMLVANEYVAKFLTEKANTTLYRIHEEPEEKDLNHITDILRAHEIYFHKEKDLNKTWQNVLGCLPDEKYHKVFDRLILRSMKKAKYSINHNQHFGLGLQTYTHFTSPIRRLCDLVVHIQLKECYFKHISSINDHPLNEEMPSHNTISLTPESLFDYAGIASEKEIIADEAERLMDSKIITSYMKNFIGKTYKAIINGISQNNIFIELNDVPVRGVIKLNQLNDDYYTYDDKKFQIRGKRRGRVFKLCDELNVILVGVADDLVFDVLDKKKKTTPKRDKNTERKKENWGDPTERKKLINERKKKKNKGWR